METLRWFLEGLLGLILDFIGGMGDVVVMLSAEFDWGLPTDLARFIGILLAVFLLAGGIARLILWKPRFNKPQSIVLRTTETPAQVLSQDIRNFFFVLVRIGIVLGLVWLVLSAAA